MAAKLFLSVMLLFVLLTLPLIISVGASSELWSQTYGGTGGEVAYSLVVTSDGGFAIAGYTESFGAGDADFWLIKTDAYGNVEWNQTYGGSQYEYARSLVETSDGGFALAGYVIPSGAGQDFYVVKTDVDGNMQWNKTYGGEHTDIAYSLVETSDGGYAIAGHSGWMFQDFLLIKIDADGNMMWNRTYGGEDSDFAYSLVETSDRGYALAGESSSFDGLWLVKTDNQGNMMWNRTYEERSEDTSLVLTSDGGFAVAGGMGDFWLVKTDNQGNMEWSRTYGGKDIDRAHSLVETSDGGYALAGGTSSFDVGQGDFWLVKTDSEGNMLWNRTYGGKNIDIAYSLVEVSGDGFALAGYTSSLSDGSDDFWLVKTDSQGIPEFPSWLILPLFLMATFVGVIVKKRLSQSVTRCTK
jgi:hypothetical protein